MLKEFRDGNVMATDTQNYPEFYGDAWDENHPTP